tara:strand:- start:115 stop:450 length:336 start_codon:yes stop_codon:yes gene_type:complete
MMTRKRRRKRRKRKKRKKRKNSHLMGIDDFFDEILTLTLTLIFLMLMLIWTSFSSRVVFYLFYDCALALNVWVGDFVVVSLKRKRRNQKKRRKFHFGERRISILTSVDDGE